MSHFKLPSDATITLKSKIFLPLPLDTSVSVADLLRNYYELAKPTTRLGLALALKYANDEAAQNQLSVLLEDDAKFHTEITESHTSIFDILQQYPGSICHSRFSCRFCRRSVSASTLLILSTRESRHLHHDLQHSDR
jgi:sulfite reductase alpha subunit-like flavoprotein